MACMDGWMEWDWTRRDFTWTYQLITHIERIYSASCMHVNYAIFIWGGTEERKR